MDHYLDLRVMPDPEFKETTLLGALVSKLHRRLVSMSADDIGISLPDHEQEPPLGRRLRVHGTQGRLNLLMQDEWLGGMQSLVDATPVQPVPDQVTYRPVRRRQYKTNAERLRRRRMRRHGESYEEARQHIPDTVERRVNTPFLSVQSSSTGERFSLFIEHGLPQQHASPGRFNTYGLSKDATVPWF